MWKAGAGEISMLQEYCTSQKQEVEADVVSARCVSVCSARSYRLPCLPSPSSRALLTDCMHFRLLAHAGFDPRQAVRFWEGRRETPQTAECSPARAELQAAHDASSTARIARRLVGGETHPVQEVRIATLKAELERWEDMRLAARAARDRGQVQSAAPSP